MIIKGLEWTFDTEAATYEKLRPGYVKELYQKLFEYIPISRESKVVEVGIGGGQASLPVLETGCELTAVEYGANFSDICREKFHQYPNFSVITGKFEDCDFEDEQYDMVYSASAFHWVPEEIGYSKVYKMLKSGGVFARFANHPYRAKGNPDLFKAISEVYGDYYYSFYNRKQEYPKEYTEEQAKETALLAAKYGFSDICYELFYRTRTFSAKEYTILLGTYSDHIAIDEPVRKEFFAKIEDTINEYGGSISIYDTIDLQLARKVK